MSWIGQFYKIYVAFLYFFSNFFYAFDVLNWKKEKNCTEIVVQSLPTDQAVPELLLIPLYKLPCFQCNALFQQLYLGVFVSLALHNLDLNLKLYTQSYINTRIMFLLAKVVCIWGCFFISQWAKQIWIKNQVFLNILMFKRNKSN